MDREPLSDAVCRIADASNNGYEWRVIELEGRKDEFFLYNLKERRYDSDLKKAAERIEDDILVNLALHPLLTIQYKIARSNMKWMAKKKEREAKIKYLSL